MIKVITLLGMVSLLCVTGCGTKKEAGQTTIKEPPPPRSAQEEAKAPAGKMTEGAASAQKAPPPAAVMNNAEKSNPDLDGMSVTALWKAYKDCRTDAEKAKEQGNLRMSVELMLKGAQVAKKLDRPGIVSWQYNNAAKHAIDCFKAECNYQKRMSRLTGMKSGDEKIAYNKETKKIMKDNFSILDDAEQYLASAKKYNSMKNDPKRVAVIESNMRFVKEMALFVE